MIIKDKNQLKLYNFYSTFWLPTRREYETNYMYSKHMSFECLEENKLYVVDIGNKHEHLHMCCWVDNYLIVVFHLFGDLEQERKLFEMLKNEELSVEECLNFFAL